MKLNKENEALGVVATTLIERKKSLCPTDEEFAIYLEGKLSKEKRKAIISHFVSCFECRERLSISTPAFEYAKEANAVAKFLSFLSRPLIMAPVAIVFLILAAITLNVYLNSYRVPVPQEKYRGGNLVSVSQVDLTPDLFKVIKGGNEEDLKKILIKELPPGSDVSNIMVEKKLKSLKDVKETEKITLILYSNGLLKVKLEQEN